MDRLGRHTRYRRAFQAGLAISVAAHVAVLGLTVEIPGRSGTPAKASLEVPAAPDAALQIVATTEDAVARAPASRTDADVDYAAPGQPGAIVPRPVEVPTPPTAAFATTLALASSEPTDAPEVPRPGLRAVTVETGFTPMQDPVATDTRVASSGAKADKGRGGTGITISIYGTGPDCVLPGIGTRLPGASGPSGARGLFPGIRVRSGLRGGFRIGR